MQKKLRTTICMALIAVTSLLFYVPISASVSNDEIFDITEALRAIGLELQEPLVPFANGLSTETILISPHLGRIGTDDSLSILTEEDVDVLLRFASIAVDLGVNFSWDTCVDYALVNAGLHDYWRDGFNALIRAGREQDLVQLATNYTIDELVQMHVFTRSNILEEFQALGFFLCVLDESLMQNEFIVPFNTHNGTIAQQTMPSGTTWTSNFITIRGDRITYSITFSRAGGGPWPFSLTTTGLGQRGFAGVSVSSMEQYTNMAPPAMTVSRTINHVYTTNNAFRIIVSGHCPYGAIIEGTYRVTW